MNDLRSFAVLQARVYQFLEKQDEATLQAIVSGAAQLAVVRSGAEAPVSSPRDPGQVMRTLMELTSESERRKYLNAVNLPLRNGLQEVARQLGLVRYSSLNKARLIDRLVSHGLEQTEASEPRTPAPPSPDPVDGDSVAEQQDTPQEPPPSTGTAVPNAGVAAIAARLRETETEEEGAAYLREQHLDRESLLGVAAELGLSRVDRLRPTELEKRVLKQAIGARRKFAGLRKW